MSLSIKIITERNGSGMNKFILNADDFGMSKTFNNAVLEGFRAGLLKSASLTANGEAFEDAISRVIPECPELSVGVHLNIIEGTALSQNLNLLTDENNNFNNSYIDLILKSTGKNKQEILNQVEQEFRLQIEKVIDKVRVSHIDSHVHTHAIPEIFKLTCRLALEYGIPFIRTQGEKPYIVPDVNMTLNKKFALNILKNILLNYFTFLNRITVRKYNLKTNDYLIGVLYTSMMNDKSIFYGLVNIRQKDKLIEALIHPCKYSDDIKESHYREFEITQNLELINKIKNKGIEISDFNSVR